jgi:hypothetical protein
MEDTLAFYGGAVKALGDGKVGGYVVLFSGADDPDLQGEYFTKSTDFKLRSGDERDILYRHGIHPVIKSRTIGRAKATIDDVGIFLEGELQLRDSYEKAIYKLAEMGKLGWSSGAMGHVVHKTPRKKAMEIDLWGTGEFSMTPNPVEPRTSAFPLKSLGDEEIDLDAFMKSLEEPPKPEEPFSTSGLPALDKFCKDVSPNSGADGNARSSSAVDAVKEFITVTNVLGEAFGVYTSRLLRRTENRALKHADPIHPDTAVQVVGLLTEMDRVQAAFAPVKEALTGLKHMSDLSKAEQAAMMVKVRYSLQNYYRISGTEPKELENAGTSTS